MRSRWHSGASWRISMPNSCSGISDADTDTRGTAMAREHLARLAKRQRAKPLELFEVLQILSGAIRKAEQILLDADDRDFALRCCHALSQACGQYSRLMAEGELEARLKVIEEALRGKVA